MKLVWLTDLHLNFIDKDARIAFYDSFRDRGDAIALTGDIAEAISIVPILEEMVHHLQKPIYFVLGNHDYYFGQVDTTRQAIKKLMQTQPLLFWLNACDPIRLNPNTLLVGEDGWADGRYGDYDHSPVQLNDSRLIADLFQSSLLGRSQLLAKMQALADADAHQLYTKLTMAASQNLPKIIVLTHVPPFKESTLYQGQPTSDDYLPFFSTKVMGDVLTQFALENPTIETLVLCGHTHDPAQYQPLPNLTVWVGKAEYHRPASQKVIEV